MTNGTCYVFKSYINEALFCRLSDVLLIDHIQSILYIDFYIICLYIQCFCFCPLYHCILVLVSLCLIPSFPSRM